jgi:hypothetical protein
MTANVILVIIGFLGMLLFAVVLWFLLRRVWPYVINQVDLVRAQRQQDQAQFMAVLGSYAKSTDGTRQIMMQMQEILSLQTNAIQRLADELNRRPRTKPPTAKRPKERS